MLLLRTLQEQTDRALADSQGKLIKSEMELANCQECVRQLEEDRARSDQEVARLKNEISVIRGTLAQVDQEKDGLLVSASDIINYHIAKSLVSIHPRNLIFSKVIFLLHKFGLNSL